MRLPKMYCLTVAQNPWRNEVVEQRFKDAGLDVEMYYGVHGQTVGIMPTTTVWDAERDNPYRISPGHTTITINKRGVWQRALDMGHEEVLIFENDVRFCDNFKEEFAKSYAALPAGWEVAHVGSCCLEGKPNTRINDRISEILHPLCCHAILFKRKAMQLAYDVFAQSYWGTPSDTILQHKVYPKLRHYTFTPALVFQDLGEGEAVKSEVYTDIQGWTTPDILRIYDEQLTGFGRSKAVVVELGTWKGRSAIYMASEIKRRHKNVDFYTIDTWEGNADEPDMQELIKDANARGGLYQEFIRNINRTGVADYIKPLRMTTVEGAKQFADHSVDFIYIDAGHSYDCVLADLESWYKKLKPGSCAAGHDIARDSVRRAVKDFCRKIGKTHREFQESWIIDGAHR